MGRARSTRTRTSAFQPAGRQALQAVYLVSHLFCDGACATDGARCEDWLRFVANPGPQVRGTGAPGFIVVGSAGCAEN
jgi:hypothetical protein